MVKKIFTSEKRLNEKSPYHISDKSLYCELLGIKMSSFLLRRYSLASVTHTCQRLWTPLA